MYEDMDPRTLAFSVSSNVAVKGAGVVVFVCLFSIVSLRLLTLVLRLGAWVVLVSAGIKVTILKPCFSCFVL